MPILRQSELRPLQEAIPGEDQGLNLSPAPVSIPDLRESVLLRAEGRGEDESGGVGGGDAAADAFFRSDYERIRREHEARGMTYCLDDYKREYGILLMDGGRWRGTTTDPFGRDTGWSDDAGRRTPRVISLEEVAA